MGIVRVLENKSVIQFFGASLILAPFLNVFASIAMAKSDQQAWSMLLVQSILSTSGTFVLLLYTASVFCGFLMLLKSRQAWSFVLVLLGLYLSKQIWTLGEDFKKHWIAGAFFAINLLVFLFIADQLVFKQKSAALPKKPNSKLPDQSQTNADTSAATERKPMAKKKRLFLKTSSGQKWAQVISISDKEIHLRKVADHFEFAEPRKIQLVIGKGLLISSQLSRSEARNIYFAFDKVAPQDQRRFRSWIQKMAAKSAA